MTRFRAQTFKRLALLVPIVLLYFFQNCSQVNFDSVAHDAIPTANSTTPIVSPSPLPTPTNVVTYAWLTSGFGSCSVSCGGGTQSQTVVCQRNDSTIVDDSFCAETPKPATSQTCNSDACEVDHWVASGFGSCSATCGGGTQTQTVICQNSANVTVDNSRCTTAMPATSQACNTQVCLTYSWQVSGFGACSVTCGGGTQTQSVFCQDSNGKTVDNSFCNAAAMPATSQGCNPQACMTYNWRQNGFGACSAACGGGTQTQSVTCVDQNGNTVASGLCTSAPPATSQACNLQACPVPTWHGDSIVIGNYIGVCRLLFGVNPVLGSRCDGYAGDSCSPSRGTIAINCY